MAYTLDLSGRSALITGGTRGIGFAIARALGAAGARVVVASRKEAAVDEAVAALEADGVTAMGVAANVGDAADRRRLVRATVERHGALDVLVNNAAANPVYGPVEDTEAWAFAKIMQVNLEAPFELAKLALPHLTERPDAHVLNVSSIGGLTPEAGLGIYSVSKAALNSLTKVLAKEWGPRGIRVNAICPGLVQTEFSEALWSDERVRGSLTRRTPLGRVGQPEEIGRLALAIVGGLTPYVTGHIFTADGGYTV